MHRGGGQKSRRVASLIRQGQQVIEKAGKCLSLPQFLGRIYLLAEPSQDNQSVMK
jgi:hypothetical protein